MKKICDLCDKEKEDAIKDDGIWVCFACNIKYPKPKKEKK